ncbi:hypothetical protein ACLB1T_22150 [Escherichia coli]
MQTLRTPLLNLLLDSGTSTLSDKIVSPHRYFGEAYDTSLHVYGV